MLSPEEQFLKAICDHADDDAPRLMYADWLTERGDPRGEFIRIQCELAGVPRNHPRRRLLEGAEQNLLSRHGRQWACPLVSPRHSVFTRGLLEPHACRHAASVAARRRKSKSLFDTFASSPPLYEFLACLLQELVIREGEVTTPGASRFAVKLKELGHPLAVLPLRRLGLETGYASPPVPLRHSSPTRQIAPALLHNVTQAGEPGRIAAAVLNWSEWSNGIWKAGAYRAARRLSPSRRCEAVLQILGDGMAEGQRLWTSTPRGAWASLFGAARTGGAYNRGELRAYGRLRAWQSFAALVGSSLEDGLDALVKQASGCTWVTFDSAWFFHVAWDLGLIVIRPDGRTAAVLAATDTD